MKLFIKFLPILFALFIVMPVNAQMKKYPNGDVYEGACKNGIPHGLGTMTYSEKSDRVSYEGNWFNGKYEGFGRLLYRNNSLYKGMWKNGVPEGMGTYIYSNQDCYEGNWKNGKYDGTGKLTTCTGDLLEGEWSHGILVDGLIECSDGSRYEGILEFGRIYKNGKLIHEKPNNSASLDKRNGTSMNRNESVASSSKEVPVPNKTDENQKKKIVNEEKCKLSFNDSLLDEFVGVKNSKGYKGKLTLTSDLAVRGSFNRDFILNGRYNFENEYTEFKMVANVRNNRILNANGSFFLYGDLNFTIEQAPSGIHMIKIYKNKNLYKTGNKRDLDLTNIEDVVMSFIPRKHFARPSTTPSSQDQVRQSFGMEDYKNAYKYVWRDSNLYNLRKSNPARFKTVFDDLNFALIKGTISDISEREEIGLLFDTTWYYVELNGAVLKTSSPSDIARFSKGQTIYAIGEFTGETYGWNDYPVFRVGEFRYRHAFFSSLEEVKNYFTDCRKNNPDSAEKYYFKKLVPCR